MTILLVASALCALSLVSRVDTAAALYRAYACDNLPSNTWCVFTERHSYRHVGTGQDNWFNNFQGSGNTSEGWWCSKLRNQDTGTEYGRICDFGYVVWTQLSSAPSSHMLPMSANGNNGSYQTVLGCAKTQWTDFCSGNG